MKTRLFGLLLLIFLGFVFGCQDLFDDNRNDSDKKGTVVIKLTDAPFPAEYVAEANITIDQIKLYRSDNDKEETEKDEEENGDNEEVNDSAIVVIELEEERTVNLLDLRNGVTEILAEAEIPAGIYREIRLHIIDAGIILNDPDSTEFDLKVPSGSESGLKIKIRPHLEILEGMDSEVLLDFDVSRSFVMRGNMKHGYDKIVGFIFKPVVRAVARMSTGDIYGVVSDTANIVIENAFLTLLSGTDTVTTALTSNEGFYKMAGIPAGTYRLECEKEGYKKQTVEDLKVEKGADTEQNFKLEKN